MLKQLVIKPTLYCYHKCPYCDLRQEYYHNILSAEGKWRGHAHKEKMMKTGFMPLELALRLIEKAAVLGMKSLLLSGGDPLLYPYLIEVIKAASAQEGVFVYMNSVGTQVTIKKAREIIAAGLGAWNFSVDTLDPVKYQKLRGVPNALAVIMNAIKTVRTVTTEWPDFCINYMTVITHENFRELPDLLEHCIMTNVASIYLMNVYADESGQLLLNKSDIKEFREEIVPRMNEIINNHQLSDIVVNNAEKVLSTFFSRENSDENYVRGIYWSDKEAAKKACNVPAYQALIEPTGAVLPCCLVEISHEGEVGDVSKDTLADVWNGTRYSRFRRERMPFCQKCSEPRHKTLGLIPKLCRQFND